MADYLHYWGNFQLDAQWDEELDHIASNQLERVKQGDRVWIVTFTDGRLMLMGRIVADAVTSQRTAARLLGRKPSELWDADWHVIAMPGTADFVRTDLDITDRAGDLRFTGASSRLPSGFNHHHLRSMRTLTPGSAQLLDDLWARSKGKSALDYDIDEEMSAYEGEARTLVVRHRRRERALRDKKIEAVLAETGALRCEVPDCGFDYEKVYGEVGRGFAHVHHKQPLSLRSQNTLTRLEDLAVVCANCHAMIHVGGKCRDLETLSVRPRQRRTSVA